MKNAFKSVIFSVLFFFLTSANAFDDSIVDSGNAFFTSIVVDGIYGERSAAQIWNPVGSGKNIYIDSILIAHSNNNPDGCDIRTISTNAGTLSHHGQNKNVGGQNSVAEIRYWNPSGGQQGGTIVHECWMGGKFNDHEYPFSPAIKLPPGTGIMVASASDMIWLIVSFQYREYNQ